MKLYFAYGANLNIANMRLRCADAVAIQPLHLEGYRLAFSGVATIVPDDNNRVPGALWAISDQDEIALDQFEGYPTLYRKETVTQDGLEFMVYVMNANTPWEPGRSYLDTIAQGYHDWGLAQEDLDLAVQRTLWEMDYDMQWSTTHGLGLATSMEKPLRGEFVHDLRWLRDDESADRCPSPVQ